MQPKAGHLRMALQVIFIQNSISDSQLILASCGHTNVKSIFRQLSQWSGQWMLAICGDADDYILLLNCLRRPCINHWPSKEHFKTYSEIWRVFFQLSHVFNRYYAGITASSFICTRQMRESEGKNNLWQFCFKTALISCSGRTLAYVLCFMHRLFFQL